MRPNVRQTALGMGEKLSFREYNMKIESIKTGKLKCLKKSNQSCFRQPDNEVSVEFVNRPTEGKSFVAFGEPIDPTASMRNIQTSPVKLILWTSQDGKAVTFATESGSEYSLVID